jgi:hypothetical protein
MTDDPYKDFAERYDWMKFKNPDRDEFFRNLFEKHEICIEKLRHLRPCGLQIISQ